MKTDTPLPEDSLPPCEVCGTITVRSGATFLCLNCGRAIPIPGDHPMTDLLVEEDLNSVDYWKAREAAARDAHRSTMAECEDWKRKAIESQDRRVQTAERVARSIELTRQAQSLAEEFISKFRCAKQALDLSPCVDDDDVEAIAQDLVLYPGAWDMEDPKDIIKACWKRLRQHQMAHLEAAMVEAEAEVDLQTKGGNDG